MTLPMHRLSLAIVPGVAAIALIAFTNIATAQITADQQSAIRSNCRSDFMSKCSGVTPGGKDALACLQKNVASLSAGCKTAVSATIPAPAQAAPVPAPAAPAAATAAPAPAVPAPAAAAPTPPPAAVPAAAPTAPAQPAKPSIATAPPPKAQTPKRVAKPAAPATQTAVAPAAVAVPAAGPTPEQMSALKFTCRADFKRHCAGIQPGGPEALACLERNAARLTPNCRTAFADIADSLPAMPVAAPAAAPAAPAPAAGGMVPGGILIEKACARYVLMHCPGMGLDMGRKVACLVDYAKSGKFVGPRCTAALKVTGHLK